MSARGVVARWLGALVIVISIGLGFGETDGLTEPRQDCAGYAQLTAALSPVTAAESAYVARAWDVWRRVYAIYSNYQYRPVYLVIVRDRSIDATAPNLRVDVYTCPYPPDADPAAIPLDGVPIYIPHVTLTRLYEDRRLADPDSLLALVLGHELGHRVNDICPDGRLPHPYGRCPDGGVAFGRTPQFAEASGIEDPNIALEVWADRRGAFYAVQAGFSLATLVGRGQRTLQDLLERHFAYGSVGSRKRQQSLERILENFNHFEDLFRLAGAAVSMRAWDLALRLLDWHAMLVAGGYEARSAFELPELLLLRAQVYYARALPDAPWPERLHMPGSVRAAFQCTPIMLTHTGLAPAQDQVRVTQRGEPSRSRLLLRKAANLVDEAIRRGGDRFVAEHLRACISGALGDFGTALDALRYARRAEPERGLPATVTRTVHHNEAVLHFLNVLAEDAPFPRERSSRSEWRRRVLALAQVQRWLRHAPELRVLIDLAVDPADRQVRVSSSLNCTLRVPDPWPVSANIVGSLLLDDPVCPSGWGEPRTRLPIPGDVRGGRASGVVLCEQALETGRLSLASVRWRDSGDEWEERILQIFEPTSSYRRPEQWGCTMPDQDLRPDVVTLRGERVYQVELPTGRRALVFADSGLIVRIIRLEMP